MDLNYLFRRQQEERSRASAAENEAARRAHEGLARQFEEEIRRLTAGRVNIADPPGLDAGPVPSCGGTLDKGFTIID